MSPFRYNGDTLSFVYFHNGETRTMKQQIFFYDIDREGVVLMHWAERDGDLIQVVANPCMYPPAFWRTMKRMHTLHDHRMLKVVDNEYGECWIVEIGTGDFEPIATALTAGVGMMIQEREAERAIIERMQQISRDN